MSASASHVRILVIDDDQDIRDLLCQTLSDAGHETVTASNGEEALRILATSEPPALILLDLMMPVMNGWQFRTAQLRDPALAGIPVLVLSASDIAEVKTTIDAAGFSQKPVDNATLLAAVARLL